MRATFFAALMAIAQLCAATPMDFSPVSHNLKYSAEYNRRAQQTTNILEIGCPYPDGYNHNIPPGKTQNILLVGQVIGQEILSFSGELICRYEASRLPTSTGSVFLEGGKKFEYAVCKYSFHESITPGYIGIKRWERDYEAVNGEGPLRSMLYEKKFIFCPILPGLTPDMTMRITPGRQ